ncbi:MAG: radical SAM protein, partial [Candidatus Aegiribacteria sp.]|nr:radical SAM protein [Candidatus Aegiribacteria sp.]
MKIFFLVHDLITVPLGVSYISSVVREYGHDVSAGVLNEKNLIARAKAFRPDVVAFGCTTGFHSKYLEAVLKIRESLDTVVVMGGAHPTFFPEVLENNPCLDFVVRGEAETAFPQLLEALEGRRELQEVGNIRFRNGGKVVQNPLLPLEEDLDAIPFPDRQLLSHFVQSSNKKAQFLITGRGCPYNCSYCFNHSYNELYSGLGKRCRRRSVDNVLEEIEELRKINDQLQMIVFQDDVFILDRNWVLEFCEQYKERGGLPFHCHLRANLVDDDITRKLSEAGCVSVKMAIESASDRLRNDVLHR